MEVEGECKDEYNAHLAFLIGLYLDLLPTDVIAKIWAIPKDYCIIVMPTDRRTLKPTTIVEASLVGEHAKDDSETINAP